MTLSEWIRATSGEEFRAGYSECAGWALRWVGAVRGVDVERWMKPDSLTTDEYVARCGGILRLASMAADDLGLPLVDEVARRGDVGVIATKDGVTAVGIATALSTRWAVKGKTRVYFLTPKSVFAAWSVERG